MQTEEVSALLRKEYDLFLYYIGGLSDDQFVFAAPKKWTAGQQLEHIYLAVRPVALAFGLPKFLIRILFGNARRPGNSYHELVLRYQSVLANGGKSSRPFIPGAVAPDKKSRLVKDLKKKIEALCERVDSYTEVDLDTLRLPHPLLGKLTMREMLYFTIYHVGHHRASVERGLAPYKQIV